MTTNQTIYGVPHAAIEWAVKQLKDDGNAGCGYFDSLRALLDAPVSVESLVGRTGGGMVWRECAVCHVKGSYHPDVQWCICGRPFEAPAALLDAPAPPSVAVGHIEQRRSMGLAIGSPITNVIWELPHPELQHLPDGAKLYLHPAAQHQGEPVAWYKPHWRGGSAEWRLGAKLTDVVFPEMWEPLYAEQPAPVASACPAHASPPPGTEPCGAHHDNDGLDEWRK